VFVKREPVRKVEKVVQLPNLDNKKFKFKALIQFKSPIRTISSNGLALIPSPFAKSFKIEKIYF
jgi:hypothetical protein